MSVLEDLCQAEYVSIQPGVSGADLWNSGPDTSNIPGRASPCLLGTGLLFQGVEDIHDVLGLVPKQI